MAEENIQLKEVIIPTKDSLASLATSSATWGTVYQKYISTNLSSEELGKGAYDAYNLLTAGKLDSFADAVCDSLSALKENTDTLCTKVNSIASEVQSGFTYILEGGAINPLVIPKTDDSFTFYNLSQKITIPIAGKNTFDIQNGKIKFTPGFIRGRRAAQLDQIAPFFTVPRQDFDTVFVNFASMGSWLEDSTLNDIFPTYDGGKQEFYGTGDLTRMGLLVWKVNCLQQQISVLYDFIRTMLSAEGKSPVVLPFLNVKKLSVEQICIVPDAGANSTISIPQSVTYLDKDLLDIETKEN